MSPRRRDHRGRFAPDGKAERIKEARNAACESLVSTDLVGQCDIAYCTEAAEPGYAYCATCMTRLHAAVEAEADYLAAQEADHMTAESPLCAFCRKPMRDGGVPLLSDHHGNPRHHGHADCWRMASMFPGML